MSKRTSGWLLGGLVACCLATLAYSQFVPPEDAQPLQAPAQPLWWPRPANIQSYYAELPQVAGETQVVPSLQGNGFIIQDTVVRFNEGSEQTIILRQGGAILAKLRAAGYPSSNSDSRIYLPSSSYHFASGIPVAPGLPVTAEIWSPYSQFRPVDLTICGYSF